MKASVILRQAAKRVQRGYCVGGCVAIKGWFTSGNVDARRAYSYFESLFKPEVIEDHGFWFAPQERDQQRILALLITADMAESAGD